ncbi:arginine--tRNA ligase [candidate division WOR-3 bacterium]|nr:arginine--tRNA ligase [candidate division WOR-3 bacterium]
MKPNENKSPSYVLDELYWEVHHLVLDLADTRNEIRSAPRGSDAIYAVPCFLHAKIQGENPVKSAEEFAERWNKIIHGDDPLSQTHQRWFPNSVIQRFEASRGYVNVFVDQKALHTRILKDLLDYGEEYGHYPKLNKTMVVDYCSPNIAKPLSVGHLRSTIIGQALINILRAAGYRVVGINFMGDWGTQFGKLLYAFEQWGNEKKLEDEPIQHLLELYVRFHKEAKENPALEDEGRAAFKRLQQGGEKERALWQRFRESSLEAFEKTVARLGVKFDHNWFESEFEERARELVDELLAKGIAEESEGAIIIRFKPLWPGKPPEPPPTQSPLVIRKSDGTTLYPTRDLASAVERIERFQPVHRLLYAVASEQTLYFSQLWNALEEMRKKGFFKHAKINQPGILEHVRFGMVSLPTGKISTREGRIVYLDELLDEAERRAQEIIKEKNPDMPKDARAQVARKVGIGAVIYADLSQDRIKDITFEWSKMLSFDGNSAPYLQYAAVRCAKILEKAKSEDRERLDTLNEQDIPALAEELKEPESVKLLMHLGRFPQAIAEAAERYAPHVLASYLYDLAVLLSRFYTQVPVLKAETDAARLARLELVEATGRVLRKGLALLGIETPEEM